MSGCLRPLLDILFPPKCVFCQKLLNRRGNEPEDICPLCRAFLTQCEGTRSFPGVTACYSLWYYEEPVRDAILRYKFGDASHYSRTLGLCLGRMIETRLAGQYDLISWTPVSRKRLRTRGYDQAQLLAQEAGRYLHMPVLRTLQKVRDNPAQSSLEDASLRRGNVKGVYAAVGPAAFAGKRVLLIDDVVTTGSTLSECAETLLAAGAAEVLAATLASARHSENAETNP